MQCELCGKETDKLFVVMIEGSKLNVCKECSSFGRVIKVIEEKPVENVVKKTRKKQQVVKQEPEFVMVKNFGSIIRKKREELGLKQEEFAKKLSIKESLLHKIETSDFEPDLDLARKLEKMLKVKLVEEVTPLNFSTQKSKSTELTIADLIKIKRRKSKK